MPEAPSAKARHLFNFTEISNAVTPGIDGSKPKIRAGKQAI